MRLWTPQAWRGVKPSQRSSREGHSTSIAAPAASGSGQLNFAKFRNLTQVQNMARCEPLSVRGRGCNLPGVPDRSQQFHLSSETELPYPYSWRRNFFLLRGGLKTTLTIAFQQVTPPASTHFCTRDSAYFPGAVAGARTLALALGMVLQLFACHCFCIDSGAVPQVTLWCVPYVSLSCWHPIKAGAGLSCLLLMTSLVSLSSAIASKDASVVTPHITTTPASRLNIFFMYANIPGSSLIFEQSKTETTQLFSSFRSR